MVENNHAEDRNREMSRWQSTLLPLMSRMIIGLTLFFFAASGFQLYYLHKRIESAPEIDPKALTAITTLSNLSGGDELEAVRFSTLALLENNLLARRYHQANVTLMSRVWIRYLGFVTGMILSLVGAAFILGKLQGPLSEITAKGDKTDISIKSASPGIVLASLGVLLMLATIVTHHEMTIGDQAIYLKEWKSAQTPFRSGENTTPPPLINPSPSP